jgi:hypothetical protein
MRSNTNGKYGTVHLLLLDPSGFRWLNRRFAAGQLQSPPLPARFAREGKDGYGLSGWSPGGFAAGLEISGIADIRSWIQVTDMDRAIDQL